MGSAISSKTSITSGGSTFPSRPFTNFSGLGVTVSDDAQNNRTNINISGGGGTGNYPAIILTPAGGTTDDTTTVQNALNTIAAQGGGELVLSGIFRISQGLTYTGTGLYLHGTSIRSGFLVVGSINTVLTLNGSDYSRISTFSITATNGSSFSNGLNIINSYIIWVDFLNMQYSSQSAITVGAGTYIIWITDCELWNCQKDGININSTSVSGEPALAIEISRCWISSSVAPPNRDNSSRGIAWNGVDPTHITQCQIIGFSVNIYCYPGRTVNNGVLSVRNTDLDQAFNYNIYIGLPGANTVGLINISDSWIGSANQNLANTNAETGGSGGIYIDAGYSVNISGCSFVNNRNNAILLGSRSTNVQITNNKIHGHTRGIWFFSGSTFGKFLIQGNTISGDSTGYSYTLPTPYGIDFNGATLAYCRILDNDFSGVSTTGMINTGGLFNTGGGSASSIIKGNLNAGLPTISTPTLPISGITFSNPFPIDCSIYITGGTVTSISVDGVVTGLLSGNITLPQDSSITLSYSSPPTWKWISRKG